MVFFTCLISFFICLSLDKLVNHLMLLVRALLRCLLPGLVSIFSCFLVSNLILLMWAYPFFDLYCTVVHAFEHVIGERNSFLLDHVIELFPWLNNIQMITWLNFDAYIPHLDSPLIILASFGCPWCGPSCFILACLHIIFFLNPMNGIPNETYALVHEPYFEDSIIGSWRPLPCKCFFSFDDGGLLRFLIMINFTSSWMRFYTRYAPSIWISWAISTLLLYSSRYF